MVKTIQSDFSSQLANTQSDNNRAASWDGVESKHPSSSRLVSFIAEAPGLDILRLLDEAFGRERLLWSEPFGPDGHTLTVVGTGVAAALFVPPIMEEDYLAKPVDYRFDEIERQASLLFEKAIVNAADSLCSAGGSSSLMDHPARPRLFGGFAFQDDFIPDNTWSMFSPAQFILPHYQAVQAGDRTYLTINALVDESESLEDSLRGLREALLEQLAIVLHRPARPVGRTELRYPMSPETWADLVESATQAIRRGQLEKVVLSRVCEVRSNEPIDGAAAFDYLDEQYSDCYRFLFEPYPHHAFFGATPELLVRKHGSHVTTMALAGSIARGRNAEEDMALADELLHSAKNRHEHQLVVQSILDSLEGLVDNLNLAAEPTVLPLRNIQHLLTPVDGRAIDEHAGILPLVRRLHPTPAMGGVPTMAAMAFLRLNEPVPRGWYAAPIGWIDARGDGLFAVAIRSAVVQHDRAWLYAGAGIVRDSEPAHEWAETALKFRPMLGALGVKEVA